MRLALTLSLLCLVAGCDDDVAPADMMMSADMSAAADMTMSTGDMAGPQTCLKVITCASGCGTNNTCVAACVSAGTMSAQQKFNDLFACAYAGCLLGDAGMAVDGGAGSCSSTSDPSSECRSCVGAEAQGPDCSTQLNACLTDS
jgi:hypothetical protein